VFECSAHLKMRQQDDTQSTFGGQTRARSAAPGLDMTSSYITRVVKVVNWNEDTPLSRMCTSFRRLAPNIGKGLHYRARKSLLAHEHDHLRQMHLWT
jgi:hypothetical protein